MRVCIYCGRTLPFSNDNACIGTGHCPVVYREKTVIITKEIQEILDRNQPRKVEIHKMGVGNEEHFRYICPKCDYYFGYEKADGTEISLLKDEFCHHCGQKLDWSEKQRETKNE